MADIPRDLGQLAKEIVNFRVESASDLRHMTDMLRTMYVDVAEVTDLAEYEIRAALTAHDAGNGKRARQVVRPLKHAETLAILAARRCATVYRQFLKVFDDTRRTPRTGRRFDPKK